jgi:hypothetical protein
MAVHCALRARTFTGCLGIVSKGRVLISRIPVASSTVLLLPAGNTAIYKSDLIQVSYFFFLLNSVATLCGREQQFPPNIRCRTYDGASVSV